MSQFDVATMLLTAFTAVLAQLVTQRAEEGAAPAAGAPTIDPLLVALNALRVPHATNDAPNGEAPTQPQATPAPADNPLSAAPVASAAPSGQDTPDGKGTSIFISHPKGDIGDVTGFACARCHTFNLFQDSRRTWYCITVGKRVGVYRGYQRVHGWVNGFPSNAFTKHRTLKDALGAWADAYHRRHIAFPPLHVRDCTLPDPDYYGEATVPPYTGEVDEPEFISDADSDDFAHQ